LIKEWIRFIFLILTGLTGLTEIYWAFSRRKCPNPIAFGEENSFRLNIESRLKRCAILFNRRGYEDYSISPPGGLLRFTFFRKVNLQKKSG